MNKLPRLDLRPISDCREIETRIEICHPALMRWRCWIKLGRISVSTDGEGTAILDGFIGRDATDPEESTARVLRLPIALLSQDCFHGVPDVTAVILARRKDFRVPPPGYDPFADPGTHTCARCEAPHPIVPEEFYVPPFNPTAYAAARGRIIRISFLRPRRKTR